MKNLISLLFFLVFVQFLEAGERSPEWALLRKEHLKRHPVCEVCGTSKDLEVHHIKPVHLYPELELDSSNLITLCKSKYWGFDCHFEVGHACNYKWDNPDVVNDAKILRKLGYGNVGEYLASIRVRVKKMHMKNKDRGYMGSN